MGAATLDRTTDEYKTLLEGISDDLHKDLDGKSWDAVQPKVQKMIDLATAGLVQRGITTYGGQAGMSEAGKVYADFGKSKGFESDELIETFPGLQGWKAKNARVAAGFLKASFM